MAPERIEAIFEHRDAVLTARAAPGATGERGSTWEYGALMVFATNAELDSPYACPMVTSSSSGEAYTMADFRLLLTRLYARIQGAPDRKSDLPENYPLECDYVTPGRADYIIDSYHQGPAYYPTQVTEAVTRLATASKVEFRDLGYGEREYWPAGQPGLGLVMTTLYGLPGCIVGANQG